MFQQRFAAVILLALTMSGAGCKSKQKEEAAQTPTDPNIVVVPAALSESLQFGTAQLTDVTGTLQVAAHVETDARRVAHVGSPVEGRILRLVVFEGQNVRPGAVLATLHSTNLSDTQMELIKAESQRGLATASVQRAEQLVSADVIGRAELERRRAEHASGSDRSIIFPHAATRTRDDGWADTTARVQSEAKCGLPHHCAAWWHGPEAVRRGRPSGTAVRSCVHHRRSI